jgi:RNA polymerase sigma-70 factor (ECF subfamily)
MRNEDEAVDAVQDACLRALRFIGGLRGGDGRVWLLAIVRNTCYSRLRRVPEEFREMVVMRELEGMAQKEIAEVAGVPIGTVMSRLARGAQASAAGTHRPAAKGVLT